MKMRIALIGAVAAFAATALLSVGLAAPAKGGAATVHVGQSKLGRILVDAGGRSLYLFEKDRRGRSACNGACAAAWPPLIASGKLHAGAGVKASLLGRTKRKDGRWQVTYNRHPLYRFVQDRTRGQTNGEGISAFGAEWYLISPSGAKVESDAMSNSGDDPAPGGYGAYGGY